ncbi:MAG: LysR family transcriptional regulator [Firmicutes bacterium]|uniref:LysR family transcriptional regulator n=1 Tax=Candidatus Scybalomonas excrementavium TaxID=2840943 RepID=A0A9D9N7R4_9FIRM|nr:LysR family transcriptional regulator [Candidatus Scybalomonas excrementavium]
MLDNRMMTFLTVCQFMNFTKAGEALNLTQPAVSQHIHYLEENYGIKLFEFKGKKMFLTKEGKAFLSAAKTMYHNEICLREKLDILKEQKKILNFGATLTIGEFLMPHYLSKYMEKNPNLIVKMQVANTKELLTKIDEGEIDFAFVEGYFSKEEYNSLVYSKEAYIAVCGKDYVLQKEPCYLEELCSERILVRERGSGTREILERAMEEQNLSLKDFISVAEIGNLQTIKALVEHHLGITFLYRRAVLKELEQGSLREIQVRDFKVHHDFNCIWRKGSIFEEEYLEIFQQMKEVEKIRIS